MRTELLTPNPDVDPCTSVPYCSGHRCPCAMDGEADVRCELWGRRFTEIGAACIPAIETLLRERARGGK